MEIIILISIAVSLSMDAFSLALAYGTINLERKYITKLSIIVGIFHFFMPLIGLLTGNIFLRIIPLKPDTVVFVVLSFIGLEMIIDTLKKEEEVKKMHLSEMLLFALAVSIDSFSVGIGLKTITTKYLLSSFIFILTSFIFTYLGLNLGNKINHIIGRISTFLGGLVLILLGIIYMFF